MSIADKMGCKIKKGFTTQAIICESNSTPWNKKQNSKLEDKSGNTCLPGIIIDFPQYQAD